MIKLARENSTDTVDIGIYGVYGSSATYSGLFRDSTDFRKMETFEGLTSEPNNTVNTDSSDGFTKGTLVEIYKGY